MEVEEPRWSVIAAIGHLEEGLELSDRDRDAGTALAVNTRRVYEAAWRRFQAWADAGGHRSLPAAPQAVALCLAADGKAMATIDLARAAISHAHAFIHSGPDRLLRGCQFLIAFVGVMLVLVALVDMAAGIRFAHEDYLQPPNSL